MSKRTIEQSGFSIIGLIIAVIIIGGLISAGYAVLNRDGTPATTKATEKAQELEDAALERSEETAKDLLYGNE